MFTDTMQSRHQENSYHIITLNITIILLSTPEGTVLL